MSYTTDLSAVKYLAATPSANQIQNKKADTPAAGQQAPTQNKKEETSVFRYQPPKLSESEIRFNMLVDAAWNAITDTIEFSRALHALASDTKCTDKKRTFTFKERVLKAWELIDRRNQAARAMIHDETTGKPAASIGSFPLFEDEIVKLLKLRALIRSRPRFEDVLRNKDKAEAENEKIIAAAKEELRVYKDFLVKNRIIIGSDGYRTRILAREADLVNKGRNLVLSDLLTNPNAVDPDIAAQKKNYGYDPERSSYYYHRTPQRYQQPGQRAGAEEDDRPHFKFSRPRSPTQGQGQGQQQANRQGKEEERKRTQPKSRRV